MFVCICNAIREADFRKAVLLHEGSVEQVYEAMGFDTQCGQCVMPAKRIMDKERARAAQVAAGEK